MNYNEREHALRILMTLIEDKASLSQLMPAFASLSPMTKEICFGVCRHYVRLQIIADALVQKRPKATEVWIALLIGLYQLHYMHTPDYAVVKETVALLEKKRFSWAKGLINAVLRTFCREKEALLAKVEQKPEFKYGQPQWLLKRLKEDWPEDWQNIAVENDVRPPMTLRINQQKITPQQYLIHLEQMGIEAAIHPVAKQAITLASPCDVTSLPGFEEGWVSVQDAAAQLAVSLLSLKPGLRVLDACCAPGGKTCHILETEPYLEACIALDVEPKRLQRVSDNLQRLKLQATVMQGDALKPESWWDGQHFDRILMDAPCSATGVIRRHADIKLLRTNEEIRAITKVQQAMLHALWPLLTPGGLLVYATCSILSDENEQQIASFVANQPDCQVVNEHRPWGRATGHGQQILPGEQGMDGFFYSVLKRID